MNIPPIGSGPITPFGYPSQTLPVISTPAPFTDLEVQETNALYTAIIANRPKGYLPSQVNIEDPETAIALVPSLIQTITQKDAEIAALRKELETAQKQAVHYYQKHVEEADSSGAYEEHIKDIEYDRRVEREIFTQELEELKNKYNMLMEDYSNSRAENEFVENSGHAVSTELQGVSEQLSLAMREIERLKERICVLNERLKQSSNANFSL